MSLQKLRNVIDKTDLQILDLLNKRAQVAQKIGKIKSKNQKEYFAPEREQRIFSSVGNNNKGPLATESVKNIFAEILHSCRSLEKRLKIAYFGPETSFTHLAAIKTFGKSVDYVSGRAISDVFDEVEKERVDYGVVPIENSTEGVINHTLDMFIESNLKICSEMFLKISHCLLSQEKTLDKIIRIYSHPQPLAQCRNWIEDHLPNARLIETVSTPEAARRVSKEKQSAAICSELASRQYKLNILAQRIEDCSDNCTRFLVIGENYPEPSGKDKTSVMFSVKDKVGALYEMLVPFKKHKINLTKIESRPNRRKLWDYIFFVDFLGHVKDNNIKKALIELEHQCLFLKVLGSYPRGAE